MPSRWLRHPGGRGSLALDSLEHPFYTVERAARWSSEPCATRTRRAGRGRGPPHPSDTPQEEPLDVNAISWFEIPVKDMARATAFYGAVLGQPLSPMEGHEGSYVFFPMESQEGVGGALMLQEGSEPAGKQGVVVYLNGGEDLAVPLGRVAAAGGQVTQEKMGIGPHGFIGFFMDPEGNHIGLHSMA